jgi:aminoglycoside phosphotransferase (APT) family kinase protein
MDEEALTGGNSNSVVRVGDTVRRPAGPWTPSVHRFLTTLRDAGIVEVPEPLGLDEHGREVLSFLPGEVGNYPMPAWMWSPAIVQEVGALLRRVHDASVPIAHLAGHWQLPTHHPVEVVCLNDVAPYNMVFQAGHLTGLIDFDTASPGPRIWDLAYLAYRLVPLGEYADDHSPAADARTQRLAALIGAYGYPFEPDAVVRVAAERLNDLAEFTDRRAADTGRADLMGHAALYRRDRDLLLSLAPNGL